MDRIKKVNNMKKILIGCPTSDYHNYALEEYVRALKSITYPHDILLVDNSKDNNYIKKLKKLNLPVLKAPWFKSPRERIITSRNLLRQHVLDKGYDYFLSLEQDVIPPPDVLEKALSHKKKILSCIYCGNLKVGNQFRVLPLIYKKPPKSREKEAIKLINASPIFKRFKKETNLSYLDSVRVNYSLEELEKEKSPLKIHSCGLGCVLISRVVLEKIEFKYSKQYGGWDDVWFCDDAKKAGFKIYVDTALKCKHLIKQRPWNWSDLLKNED
jgi:GT2 family glycosyltransferase